MNDEIEPIDLEPIELEPGDDLPAFERRPDLRTRWLWIGLVGVGLVIWAVIALRTGGTPTHPSATPPTIPAAVPKPATTESTIAVPTRAVDRFAAMLPSLRATLPNLGSGRFAAVIDDRLYVLDETDLKHPTETLVPLSEGHATIDQQSGTSLLASTFAQTLVSTTPIATRSVSVRDMAFRAVAPEEWWLLHDDGTIRNDKGGAAQQVPAGLRVVAAVRDGFVGLDAKAGWVVWSKGATRSLPVPGGQLLTAGPDTVVFKSDCGYNGCRLDIADLRRGTLTEKGLPIVPEFAALSPDGTRLALASTLGDVYILDPKSGEIVSRNEGLTAQNPSLPFTWTTDSRVLLVVRQHDIEVFGAYDGRPHEFVSPTDGLEQIVALS